MSMKFAPIVNPDARKPAPKPVRVDLRVVFLTGTALWLVGFVVCLILSVLHFNVTHILHIAAAGLIIGILMLIWERFDRADYRRLGE